MLIDNLMVLNSAVESDNCNEEKKNAGSDNPADSLKARYHVGRLPVGRHTDEQKGNHLETNTRQNLKDFHSYTAILFVKV